MKKLLISLTKLFIMINAFGQAESAIYNVIANKFENEYNLNLYDSIFQMFSAEMQTALPLDKTVEFFTGLNNQAGKITQKKFIKFQMQTYASYKANFERALLSLNISIDKKGKINGLFIKPFTDDSQPKMERTLTRLVLPFNDSWNVFWGGDTRELNYHIVNETQKHAFDFLIFDKNNKSYKTDGKSNEDYYAFGKEIIAPCDGEIVLVIDGVKDNIPGETNALFAIGNAVILKTVNNEFLVLCHFKHQSIKVSEGQKVIQGQLLGLCGNTGQSTEPHLHFHVQNIEDINRATGVKCYFDKIIVNGLLKNDYSPVKNDIIYNMK